MYKKIILFIVFLFSIQMVSAQNADEILKQRGEVYFSFDFNVGSDGIDDLNAIGRIISINKVSGNKVFAYANASGFEKFRDMGYPYSVLTPPSLLYSKSKLYGDGSRTSWDFYPTYTEYIAMMQQFTEDYPDLCELVNIGSSVQGRDILFIHINDSLGVEQAEPEFMYTSTMHGDETTGYVMMLRLIEYLLENYGADDRITNMVNSIDIWINPLANPDGTYAAGTDSVYGAIRYNANYVDLNRNYPDPDDGPHPDGNAYQAETQAFMDFAEAHHFSLSANLHTGAEVANYPWDTWAKHAADNDWWVHVCRQYADMAHLYSPDGYMTFKNDGITNGYAWYSIEGGRQDYMNYEHHCREFTLELSDIYIPPADTLPHYWEYNYRSLLNYMEQSLFGLHGIITDAQTGEPVLAEVFIEGHDEDQSQVYSSSTMGNYHRFLFAGEYSITFRAGNYEPFVVDNVKVGNDSTTVVNVQLDSLVGIDEDEILQNQVQVYPNPTKDRLTIQLPFASKEIILRNSTGQEVLKVASTSSQIQLELGVFPKGVYFLEIRFDSQKILKKIVVL